jgi:hypothetical protein
MLRRMKHDCRRLWTTTGGADTKRLENKMRGRTSHDVFNKVVYLEKRYGTVFSRILDSFEIKLALVAVPYLFATMMRLALRYASGTRMYPRSAFKRHLATIAEEQPPPPASNSQNMSSKLFKPTNRGALRPTMGIPVNPDHGLYHFFRKVITEDSLTGYDYVAFEAMDDSVLGSS